MLPSPDSSPQQLCQHLRWSGGTDVGRFRKNNEDAFLALTFDAQQLQYLGKTGEAPLASGDFLFAVSDGMGGANAGEFASRIAVQKIAHFMPRCLKLAAAGFEDRGELDFLEELFSLIHNEMLAMGRHYEECRGMGATLTLCWLTQAKAFFAHIGDSRLYYLPRGGQIMQVSQDHTHVAWLLRTRKITAAEARFHPQRNMLQQALGGNVRKIEPQFGTMKLESGDQLVLCSDGITDGISQRRIETLLLTPPEPYCGMNKATRLIEDAKAESGRDNLTALAIEFL